VETLDGTAVSAESGRVASVATSRGARLSSLRLHALLVLASVLVPAGLFLAAAAQNRADVLREGEDAVLRTVLVLQEHARKVFETQELALARVDDRIQSLTWEQVSAPETSAFLARLKAPLEQAVSIWVTDRDGVVRAGSQDWDSRVNIADREFFAVHRDGFAELHVSAAFRGRATRTASFALSRRRSTPDDSFDGIIHVALSPDYFAGFFSEAAPPFPHTALLVRADGAILARDPKGPRTHLVPDGPLMRSIETNSRGGLIRGISPVSGQEQIFAYRRLGDWPLYVAFAVNTSVLLERWQRNLILFGASRSPPRCCCCSPPRWP
jgi:hypothetical protein